MENDTLIHVLLSAYYELLHLTVNHLDEYINDLTGTFKIFNNKIESDQQNCWRFFCLFDLLPFRDWFISCKILTTVAELERYSLS